LVFNLVFLGSAWMGLASLTGCLFISLQTLARSVLQTFDDLRNVYFDAPIGKNGKQTCRVKLPVISLLLLNFFF